MTVLSDDELRSIELPVLYLAEVFYRVQLSSRFAITPDLQFVINPALNTEQSSMFIWGIRGRLSL